MSQCFDDMILLLPGDASNYRCEQGELIYSYHRVEKSACQHDKRGLFQRLASKWSSNDLAYFRIRPKQQVALPSFDAILKDLAGNLHQIECSVSILGFAPDREADAICRLAESGAPLDALRTYVVTWLDDFAVAERRNGRDMIENLTAAQRAEAAKHIAARALEILGLKLECGLFFPEQDQKLPVLKLQLTDVRIRETDLPGQISAQLEIHLNLPIDPQRFDYARRMRKSQGVIRHDLEAIARDWFRSACTLEQFCFARDDVRRGVQTVIRSYVEDKLYMDFDSLTVQCEVPFPKEFRIRLEYSSKGVVQPGSHELVVNHQLDVKRADLGRFYADGPRPSAVGATPQAIQEAWNKAFEEWVDQLLKRVTHHAFFGKSYAEVSLRFKDLCADLKKEVQGEFEKIGFVVHQLISLPADEQILDVIEKKFTFDTSAIHCKTREANVDYSISAHVQLEVDSLGKIEKYLRPGQALQNQFIQVTTDAIRNAVRTLEPEKLYTEFGIADPKTGDQSPEEKIHTALKAALKDKFDASEDRISITLTPEPTDVTKLYDALRPPESHRCTVLVEARGSRGEQLTIEVDYRVTSIALGGWSNFQEQCRKNLGSEIAEKAKAIIEAINKAFASKAAAKLVSLSAAQLTSPHQDMPKVLEAFGLSEARQEVSDFLGLEIRIVNVEVRLGEWATRERNLQRECYEATLLDYRAARAQYREREQQYEPGDPRLEEAGRHVEECEAKLRRFGTGHDEYFKDALTLPPPAWEAVLRIGSGGVDAKPETPKLRSDDTESDSKS